jgi:hypothetical protein
VLGTRSVVHHDHLVRVGGVVHLLERAQAVGERAGPVAGTHRDGDERRLHGIRGCRRVHGREQLGRRDLDPAERAREPLVGGGSRHRTRQPTRDRVGDGTPAAPAVGHRHLDVAERPVADPHERLKDAVAGETIDVANRLL